MAERAWTARLQNMIWVSVSHFDNNIVYDVLHGTKCWGKIKHAFRWVEWAGLFNHDRETHLKMIDILGRVSKLNIMLDMPKKGFQWDEDMFEVLIESYVLTYDTLFKVILRRGRYMMAKRYFNKMLSERIEPTRHTYNVMLWGFFFRLETAFRFSEDMKSGGVAPDVVLYDTMINGYGQFKKVNEAEKLIVEVKEDKLSLLLLAILEMKSCNVKPNAITDTALLPSLCDVGKVAEAPKVLREMVERYIAPKDNSIFMKLLTAQCKSGDLNAAADVLNAMIRLSIPTQAGRSSVLIANFCKREIFDLAIKLSALDMEASAYNPMMRYLCQNGQTGKIEIILRQLMKKEGNPDSAFDIIKIMGRRGVPREADAYTYLIESYLRKGEPMGPASSLWKSVMESLFENGRVQTASKVMKSRVERILEALLMRGHVEEALGLIDLLTQSACVPTFDSLLYVLFEKGKTICAKLLDYYLERDCIVEFSSYEKVLDDW
ncbi:pentatricopeptide repeat-containing protein [Citrus sinensis]|nr:pentatricopeptide repeat-containing protein [Citrus sinensis]